MDIKQTSADGNTSKYRQTINLLLNTISSKTYDKRLIQLFLCNLTEIHHRAHIVDPNTYAMLINNLFDVIQPADSELIKLQCQYVTQLIKDGIFLDSQFFKFTIIKCYKWIVSNMQHYESSVTKELLTCLKYLVNLGPNKFALYEFHQLVSNGHLQSHISPKNNKWNENNFLALLCLEVYLISLTKDELDISFEHLLAIKNVLMNALYILPENTNNKHLFNKSAFVCLRLLHTLMSLIDITEWPDMTGEILGIVQAYLFYGIKGCSVIKPETLRPAAMNLPGREQMISKRNIHFQNKARERRNRSKKSNTENTPNKKSNNSIEKGSKVQTRYSSDSETSDNETFNSNIPDWKVQLKVVQLLCSLKDSISSRELFGYWPQIIASSPDSSNNRVLTRFLLKVPDPSKKVRQVALNFLAEIIEGARNFLSHAEDVEHTTFLPFFGMVSAMIKELHYTLSLLLSNIKHFLVLTQVLKCAAALAQSTPYSRLKPGLATKLIRNCRVYLLHSDPTVQVAVLLVFEALASTNPITDEIITILEKSSSIDISSEIELHHQIVVSDIESMEEEEEFVEFGVENVNIQSEEQITEDSKEAKISSLVRVCLHNITKESVHGPVRIQSLKLLGIIALNAGKLISEHIELIAATLVTGMKSLEHQIALHACRVIETISGCLSKTEFSHINPFLFWNIVFEPAIGLMQHTQTMLREAACNCLSSIGSETLSRLSREKIILIITLLFGAARDEESAVRAAGVRALGVLVTSPVMEEDTGFLMDLADITSLATEDANLGVRIKATWALASLCDTLLKRENNPELELVPLEIVMPKLFEASINASHDNNKVKSNAMRALGSIMCVCTGLHILKDTSDALNALISCATKGYDMKIRWNACHALGIILSRNPDQILPPSWKDEVFPVLSSLICDSANFKVRINAAWAISVCTSFGKYVPSLWKNIILALENAQHVPNYVEYTHHDALVQQLCLAFCHIVLYTELSDLNVIWPDISEHIKDLYSYMKHFQLYVLPEKAGDLLSAKMKFNEFLQKATTLKEKSIAETLVELLEKTNALDI